MWQAPNEEILGHRPGMGECGAANELPPQHAGTCLRWTSCNSLRFPRNVWLSSSTKMSSVTGVFCYRCLLLQGGRYVGTEVKTFWHVQTAGREIAALAEAGERLFVEKGYVGDAEEIAAASSFGVYSSGDVEWAERTG